MKNIKVVMLVGTLFLSNMAFATGSKQPPPKLSQGTEQTIIEMILDVIRP
jgi:hypothetical protein